MKKRLISLCSLLLLACFICSTFAGCGDDNEDLKDDPLIGNYAMEITGKSIFLYISVSYEKKKGLVVSPSCCDEGELFTNTQRTVKKSSAKQYATEKNVNTINRLSGNHYQQVFNLNEDELEVIDIDTETSSGPHFILTRTEQTVEEWYNSRPDWMKKN